MNSEKTNEEYKRENEELKTVLFEKEKEICALKHRFENLQYKSSKLRRKMVEKIKEVENKKKELMEKEKESCADEYFFYEMYGCDSQLIMLKELLSNENKG